MLLQHQLQAQQVFHSYSGSFLRETNQDQLKTSKLLGLWEEGKFLGMSHSPIAYRR